MARKADPLAAYNAKRDFAKTAEPAGTAIKGSGRRFIVQKHDATRLHWDFRLEVDGVLKSWAVTRGPSLDPDQKRLAVRTEDHPLSYADFEGVIPRGEYGGGTVMLWDVGEWAPIAGKSARDLEEGHLHFTLTGERMKGEWLLIRLKPRGGEKREHWLLRKIDDAHAGGTDTLVEEGLTSVTTGRTMREIADGKTPRPSSRRGGTLPTFRPLQLCTLVDAVPAGDDWLHEMKYDGYRALIAVGGGKAKVFTRTGLDWTDRFAAIADAAAGLPVASALIDGEVVALKDGRPDFSTLQAAIKGGGAMEFFAFDLLSLDGRDLAKRPLAERKALLEPLIDGENDMLRYSQHVRGSGDRLFAAMCREGYEGVVSKLADAPYRGTRTKGWVKTKCSRRQEFVIVGWAPSDKAGRGFKSLLLAVNGKDGLRYAGRVGTGFDTDTMIDLRAKLDRLARKTAPVDVPRTVARGVYWVSPKLVAEVTFAEFTADEVVRHASFVGLRGDKPASDVVVERPVTL